MAFSRQEYRSGFPLPSPESLKRIHKITAQFVESFTQLSSLLRNLYAGQEATVRTGHEKMGWFKIGKRIYQGCTLSLCLFNVHAEYIMRNAGLHRHLYVALAIMVLIMMLMYYQWFKENHIHITSKLLYF